MGKTWRDGLVAVFALLSGFAGIAFLGLAGYLFLLDAGLCEYDNCPTDAETTISLEVTAALLAVPLLWMSAAFLRLFTGDYPSLRVCAGLAAIYATYSVAAVGLYSWLDSSNKLSSDADYYWVLAVAGIGLLVTWLGSIALAIRLTADRLPQSRH